MFEDLVCKILLDTRDIWRKFEISLTSSSNRGIVPKFNFALRFENGAHVLKTTTLIRTSFKGLVKDLVKVFSIESSSTKGFSFRNREVSLLSSDLLEIDLS